MKKSAEFYRAKTAEQAVSLLRTKERASVLAGGTDLIIAGRQGKKITDVYVDIMEIPELKEIRIDGGELYVGAAVTCSEAERNPLLQRECPLLCRAAAAVGSPQIRSRATFGGNVVNASPAADTAPALAVLEAQAEIVGTGYRRRVKITEFITGNGKTVLEKDELLAGFYIPLAAGNVRYGYKKIGRRNALAISRMNGACLMKAENGVILEARICIGAVADRPLRCTEAERLLNGKKPDGALWEQAGQAVRECILAHTGIRNSSGYKLPVSKDFAAELLKHTWEEQYEDRIQFK